MRRTAFGHTVGKTVASGFLRHPEGESVTLPWLKDPSAKVKEEKPLDHVLTIPPSLDFTLSPAWPCVPPCDHLGCTYDCVRVSSCKRHMQKDAMSQASTPMPNFQN